MNITDIIGSIGVMILLIAYFININDYVHNDHPLYICLNIVGGILALSASIMLKYYPFIVLETIWCMVSLWALIVFFKRDYKDYKKRTNDFKKRGSARKV